MATGTLPVGQSGPLQVEDHPAGYPRFAALIGSHPSFYVFRRFGAARARILLHKQDTIVVLEQKLAQIDEHEPNPLFRGCYRKDANEARKQILGRLDVALREYDDLVERTDKVLRRRDASLRDTRNVQNWIRQTPCVARNETSYLSHTGELMAVLSPNDDDLPGRIEAIITDGLVWLFRILGKTHRSRESRSANVHIFPQKLVEGIGRVTLTSILIVLIFVPTSAVIRLAGLEKRLGMILLASTTFLATLSIMGRAKTAEFFAAGATYATVLVVLVANAQHW